MEPDEYYVERIIDKKQFGKEVRYKVLWEGFSKEQSTWEPIENLQAVLPLIEEFEDENKYDNIPDLNQKQQKRQKIVKLNKSKKQRVYPSNDIGSFKKQDKPNQIIQTKICDQGLLHFEVEWQPRQNGEWPINNYYNQKELRQYAPLFLIDYYENKIKKTKLYE